MTDDLVTVGTAGTTRQVRLARPDKLNALTGAMYDVLTSALREADADPAVGAVLLAGEGRAFCSGNDLADFVAHPPSDPDSPVLRFLDALMTIDVPLVVAVHGQAVGIGTTLLLHADVVVADETARFSLPFVPLGVVPEAASSLLLPRMIGPRLATRMLLTGEPIDAPTAFAAGLVTELVPPGEHEGAATRWAERIGALPRESVRLTKRLLHRPDGGVRERSREEAELFAARLHSPEFRAAAARFLG